MMSEIEHFWFTIYSLSDMQEVSDKIINTLDDLIIQKEFDVIESYLDYPKDKDITPIIAKFVLVITSPIKDRLKKCREKYVKIWDLYFQSLKEKSFANSEKVLD